MCEKLEEILKLKPFFDCVGGCGVDLSNGESNCMSGNGIWFRYCPFCGKEIISENINGYWSWDEKEE